MNLRMTALWASLGLSLAAQDAKTVLDNAARTLGSAGLRSIQYSGGGAQFSLGQNVNPQTPWPRFNVKSYTRTINFDAPASREEIVRVAEVRSGPPATEQRLQQFVSGRFAWNLAGNNPVAAPSALAERLTQIWITPHGFVKAALASNPTLRTEKSGGRTVSVVSFLGHGKIKVTGVINEQNLVERVETTVENAVLGDMPVITTYSDYKDFGAVKFPARIAQQAGGFPTLDLSITGVTPNAPAAIDAPQSVQTATAPPVRVESQKVADGVWYLAGGSHHSVLVEFANHVTVIEGPLNTERSKAVIAEVKKLVPNKPIRFLVNTHHHFDHSGGVRAFVDEGAAVVTHRISRSFYQRVLPKNAKLVTLGDKRVMKDSTRAIEIHHIRGNPHHDGILMVYFPKEKLLAEVDVFTPPAPNAAPPATPSPAAVNLYENIERLKLDVAQILPLHGRIVPIADLKRAIGK